LEPLRRNIKKQKLEKFGKHSERKELVTIFEESEKILKSLGRTLTRYNALDNGKTTGKKIWQQFLFGTREVPEM
jgi:hypothetical protein